MEFGHVYEGLEDVDFSLPLDGEFTQNVLKENKTDGGLSIHIGTSKFGDKSWKGIIYPLKALDKELLTYYSKLFNTVEFGPTFYNLYSEEEVKLWTDRVTESPAFKFCPKFPQTITHIRRLANAEEQTKKFYRSLNGFGDHLGPILLQLSDNFSPKSLPNLKAYLTSLDPAIKVNVEIRNKNWFSDSGARQEVFNLLYELNIGTAISDTSGRRDCVHMELTTTDAFIRFVGNNLADSDYKRMDDWVERIKDWSDRGLRSLWFFMHQNDEKYAPQACIYLIDQLNAKLGTSIEKPKLITDQLGFDF